MPKFYVIFAQKINKMRMPEFYMIFARKISRNLEEANALPAPLSPMPMVNTWVSYLCVYMCNVVKSTEEKALSATGDHDHCRRLCHHPCCRSPQLNATSCTCIIHRIVRSDAVASKSVLQLLLLSVLKKKTVQIVKLIVVTDWQFCIVSKTQYLGI